MSAPIQKFSILSQRDALNVHPGRLFINGRWLDGQGERWDCIHPSTNEITTSIACATGHEVDLAVAAARDAFDNGPWPQLRARERRVVLQRLSRVILDHADELTRLQTLDNGVPISFSGRSRLSGAFSAELFDYFSGWIDKLTGETYPLYAEGTDLQFLSFREPVGVVAAVIPWNGPLMQFTNKVAPALAAGCTVVVKPSEQASLCVLRLAEIIAGAGLPPGVFNLVTGLGSPTGEALITHPGVDKVSFTGSKAVGEHILSVSGSNIKRVTLELGGKSAGIVCQDADIGLAAASIMGLIAFGLSGQVCTAQTRALVHRSLYDGFLAEAKTLADRVVFGDPFDVRTTSAAIISKRQLQKVLAYIQGGLSEGAQLMFGGQKVDGDVASGNFVQPALFSDVNNNSRIAQEEIFGPVLCVMPFDDEDEAIALANDSPYGLASGIYTPDIRRALRLSRRLRAGAVGINGYSFVPNSPVGGYKSSGLGREGGRPAIEAYTELKTVMIGLT